jgi:hypothetical protein
MPETSWPKRAPATSAGETMVLLGTLRVFGLRPATAVFKGNECQCSISEPVGHPPASTSKTAKGGYFIGRTQN